MEFEKRAHKLFDERFPRDLPSRLRKLGEEVGELNEAVASYLCIPVKSRIGREVERIGEEAADVALVLVDILHIAGCRWGLEGYMTSKLAELKTRKPTPQSAMPNAGLREAYRVGHEAAIARLAEKRERYAWGPSGNATPLEVPLHKGDVVSFVTDTGIVALGFFVNAAVDGDVWVALYKEGDKYSHCMLMRRRDVQPIHGRSEDA